MKVHTHLILLAVVFLNLMSRIPFGNAAGQCKLHGSNFGKALKRHMIDKLKVDRPVTCINICQNEPKCQSINYEMEERPHDYVTDPRRIYMTVPFNKGMQRTLSSKYLSLSTAAHFLY